MDEDDVTHYDMAIVLARHLIDKGADRYALAAELRNSAARNRKAGMGEAAAAFERVAKEITAPH